MTPTEETPIRLRNRKELENEEFLTRDMDFYMGFQMSTDVEGFSESLVQKAFLESIKLRKKLKKNINDFDIDTLKKNCHAIILNLEDEDEELKEHFKSCHIEGIGCVADEEANYFITNYKDTFEDRYRFIISRYSGDFFYEDSEHNYHHYDIHKEILLVHTRTLNTEDTPFIQLDLTQSDKEILETVHRARKYIEEKTYLTFSDSNLKEKEKKIIDKTIRKKGLTKGMKYANMLFIYDCLELGMSEMYITEQIDTYFHDNEEISFTLKVDTYKEYKKEILFLINS